MTTISATPPPHVVLVFDLGGATFLQISPICNNLEAKAGLERRSDTRPPHHHHTVYDSRLLAISPHGAAMEQRMKGATMHGAGLSGSEVGQASTTTKASGPARSGRVHGVS